MKFNALSPTFDSVYVLVHETGSDDDIYGEGVSTHKWHMEQRVAEAGSFRTMYRSQPSNKAFFRIKFGPEPVSNTAEKGGRLSGSDPMEQDTR